MADRIAPDFVLEDTEGRKIGLADYRGKTVVLNFIYARCKAVAESSANPAGLAHEGREAGSTRRSEV